MSQAPRIFTPEEIEILKRCDLPMNEMESILHTSYRTIRKYQKLFGIVWTRTTKKGVARPHCIKKEIRNCLNPKCNNTFEVIPSRSKRYCSRSCFITENNPAFLKKPRKLRNPNTPAYKRYANKVHHLSQKTYEENINIINPNRYSRTLCGVDGGYQLDHIMTIKECFENNIPAEKASRVENLRMLKWKENLMRQYK